MKQRFERCTIYRASSMMGNYVDTECRWVEVEIRPYAQYPAALHVTCLPKGKRRPRVFVEAYNVSLVVADGWGNAEAPEMFGVLVSEDAKVSVRKSSHTSFSPKWKQDFEDQVKPSLDVLADFSSHNSRLAIAS